MAATVAESGTRTRVWLGRLRFVVATAMLWAALHYVLGGYALPRGLDRPPVLVSGGHGFLAGILAIALLWLGAAVVSVVTGAGQTRQPLMILGLALALWAFEGGARGGTMDSWLRFCNEKPGPPSAGPYWLLLVDYAYLLIAVGGAYFICARLAARRGAGSPSTESEGGFRSVMAGAAGSQGGGSGQRHVACGGGLVGLLLASIVGGVVALVLMGPSVGSTWRGQVYFAVGVGCLAGTYVARRVTGVAAPCWLWLTPFVLGVVGVVAAGINPALMLPAAYRHINTIPAWGLARPLPVEMVGVGLVASMWGSRRHQEEERRPPS